MMATTSMMRKGVGVSAVTETPSDIGWRRTALVAAGDPSSTRYFALAARITS